jgi:hypothetical protein
VSAERIVSAIQHSALYAGIKIETKGAITDRGQRSEVRDQISEVRYQKSKVRCQMSDVRSQRTEDGGRRRNVKRSNVGLFWFGVAVEVGCRH